MSAVHINPKVHDAACKVDSMVLASALDHIARTARKSRTQTRRLRWIEARADGALAGKDSVDDIDLPKDGGDAVASRLQEKLQFQHALRKEALAALRACVEHMEHSTPQGAAAYAQAAALLPRTEVATGSAL